MDDHFYPVPARNAAHGVFFMAGRVPLLLAPWAMLLSANLAGLQCPCGAHADNLGLLVNNFYDLAFAAEQAAKQAAKQGVSGGE